MRSTKPHLFETVFRSVSFFVDPTYLRILVCRRLKRDIFELSDVYGFISPGFVRTRPAFYVSSRTPIQGTRYVNVYSCIDGVSKDVSLLLVLSIFFILPNVNIAYSNNTQLVRKGINKGSL